MSDVYKFSIPGASEDAPRQEFAFHGPVSELKKRHPGAVLMGRLVCNALGECTFETITQQQAMAHERKAASGDEKTTTTTAAPVVAVESAPAKKDAKKDA